MFTRLCWTVVFQLRDFWHMGSWEQLMAWWARPLLTSFQVTSVKGLNFLEKNGNLGVSWLTPVLTLTGQSCLSKQPVGFLVLFFFLICSKAKKNLIRAQQCTHQQSLSFLSHPVAASLSDKRHWCGGEDVGKDWLLFQSPWRRLSKFPCVVHIFRCFP